MILFLYRLLLTITISISIATATTQAQQLSISIIGSVPDTLQYGQTVVVNATVTNIDSIEFNEIMDFEIRNDVGLDISTTGIFSKPPYSGDTIILTPGESIPAYFSLLITTASFAANTFDHITIWPSSIYVAADSIRELIFIKDSITNIDERYITQHVAYLSGNTLHLKARDITTVELYSTAGQQVGNADPTNSHIDYCSLASGVYFIRLSNAKKQHFILKFNKQ